MNSPVAVDPDAICPGCGHPMRDHFDADGELIGIPVETPDVDPATCFAGQTEREKLWDEHDRRFISDADYEAALKRLASETGDSGSRTHGLTR